MSHRFSYPESFSEVHSYIYIRTYTYTYCRYLFINEYIIIYNTNVVIYIIDVYIIYIHGNIYRCMLHTHTHPQCNLPLQSEGRKSWESFRKTQERRSILERFRRLVRDPGTPEKPMFRFGWFFVAHVFHASETKVYVLCVDIYILFAYIIVMNLFIFMKGSLLPLLQCVGMIQYTWFCSFAYIICIYHISTCVSSLRTLCVTCCFG